MTTLDEQTLLTQIFNEKSEFKVLKALQAYVELKGDPQALNNGHYRTLYVDFYMKQHGYDTILLPLIADTLLLQFKYFHHIPHDAWFDPSIQSQLSDDFKQFAFSETQDARFQLNDQEQMFFDIDTCVGIIAKSGFKNKWCSSGDSLQKKRQAYEGEFTNPYAKTLYQGAMERLTYILTSPEWDAYVAGRPKKLRSFFTQMSRHFCDDWISPPLRPVISLLARHPFAFDALFSGHKLTWDLLCYLPPETGPTLSFSLTYTFESLVTALEVRPDLYELLPLYLPHLKKIRSFEHACTPRCDLFKMEEIARSHKEFGQWWTKIKNKLEMLPPYASFPTTEPVYWEKYIDNLSLVNRYKHFYDVLEEKAPYYQKVVNHSYDLAFISGIYPSDMLSHENLQRITVTQWMNDMNMLEDRYQQHLQYSEHSTETNVYL